jgi:hypothetical protein
MANQQLAPFIETIEDDSRVVNLLTKPINGFLCEHAGGWTQSSPLPATIQLNVCAWNAVMGQAYGIRGGMDTLLAHELGHLYACWYDNCVGQDQLAVVFENYLRGSNTRPGHGMGSGVCPNCKGCQ